MNIYKSGINKDKYYHYFPDQNNQKQYVHINEHQPNIFSPPTWLVDHHGIMKLKLPYYDISTT